MAKVSLILLSSVYLTASSTPSARNLGALSPFSVQAEEGVTSCVGWFQHTTARPYGELLNDLSVTFQDFEKWNPDVEPLEQGLIPGRYYCIAAAQGPPAESSDGKLQRRKRSGPEKSCYTITGFSKTEQGCPFLYHVQPGDTCHHVQILYGMSFEDLFKWNPSIGKDCGHFPAGVYLCVKKPSGVLNYGLSGLSVG
ncbi:hypothetical protein XA68_10826 [Ophiocordyceps unilateralis]|uniref:LysM domain-containing protein n=1 Tax=Ophiocordyceps unilateralis TaxID=268505 RepID=A0A2A9PHW8_OPHUN|nr:hypothetical protein XA68_10826 [Ophiocordyceps unilateralis]